jgi:PhzF family phenazine biosynthesis protein
MLRLNPFIETNRRVQPGCMMKVPVHVIHAFSVNGEGGNPAGVVFDADQLSAGMKQEIARLAGFPETAFVSSSSVADFKLDFFTPIKQIPHCGHATIATFTWLKSKGIIAGDQSSKETIDGIRKIFFRDGKAFMEQRSPRFETITEPGAVLSSLRITGDQLLTGHLPTIVNTGNSFLMVPLHDQEVLANLQYDHDEVYALSEHYGLIGFYPFAASSSFDATTRMFGPFYGIPEESGTGMAAGPLAAYLSEFGGKRKENFRIEQGRFMKPASPSLIEVELEYENGAISRLFAGGSAHVARSFDVDIFS